MDASQIIETHGGSKAFAESLGKTPVAVRVWKSRNRIPRTAWPEVMARYPAITMDLLLASERAS